MVKTIISERYVLQREIGSGGMGVVYLAQDTLTDTKVAVKALKTDVANSEMIERFKREGEALRELNHPNIVKMLDAFEHAGQHYLVMEYVSGIDLSHRLAQGRMQLEDIINLSIDLADALTRAHRLNIIHRDLKPANVLIGDDGVLRLTDFGVAHVGSKERVTETDAIIGTLDYLPPEAFDGTPFDARGDIWAFGVILFEMLTGERPFKGDSLFEVIQAISTQPIPDLEALNPDCPIALVDLIYRMLERDPRVRIPSVRRVGTELEDILQGRDKAIATKRFDTPLPDYVMHSKYNLPAQATPFVGREHELAELENLLKDSDIRLITILAQGGMGKTRLALELAQQAVDQNLYADGVYFVELAPLSDADNIPNAIADAAGYQFLGEGTPKEQLLTILRERNLLLVMDNFEHLPEGFGLVGDILKSAPNVHIIATSRQRLSETGETLFHLSGMDFPDWETPDDALEYAAIKLFMNSAKRVRPDFELTSDNLDAVAQICKLVEGMPLGIVLAASWLAVLSLSEIAEEIQGSLDFLETDETELPERQRSIRAVMDYSWTQMTEAEQQVFMKLSVFRGGFTREAAQEVAGANLRILMSLVNKSLVRRDADTGRYDIHELLRQYAEEHLQQSDKLDILNQLHMQYFAEFMVNRAPDIKGRRQIDSLNEIESDFDNIREAWIYAVNHVDYESLSNMMETLTLFCEMRSLYKIGEELFQDAVDKLSRLNIQEIHPIFNRLRIYFVQVWILQEKFPIPDKILQIVDDCLPIAQLQEDTFTLMFYYKFKGWFHRGANDTDKVLPTYERALNLAQNLKSLYYEGRILREIDNFFTFHMLDNSPESKEVNHRHQEITQKISDQSGLAHAIYHKFMRDFIESRFESIEEHLREALFHFQAVRDMRSIGTASAGLGTISFYSGNLKSAESNHEEALQISSKMNYLAVHSYIYAQLSMIYSIGGHYGRSYEFIQKALGYSAAGIPHIAKYFTDASIVLHSIGVSDFKHARAHLLDTLISAQYIPVFRIMPFSLSAFWFHHADDKLRAVELLGLASIYHSNTIGWMEKWALLTQLQHDIKAELGEEAYNIAWKRGKSLDPEIVVQELIAEFSEDD
jgi:predicted ATPase